MEDRNSVLIAGAVRGINRTPGITFVTVATDGGIGRKRESSYPTVLFFGGLEDDFAINTHVTIRGHVSTRFVREDDRTRYVQEYIGEEIEASKRPLSAFIDDITPEGARPSDRNEVVVIGDAVNIYPVNEDLVLLSIESKIGDRKERCECSCFRRQAYVASILEKGDRVAVAGDIQTSPDKNNRRIIHQNVICRDIEILPREDSEVEEVREDGLFDLSFP